MKYDIVENPDGSHTLTRHGESKDIPNNAELQFWQQREILLECIDNIETNLTGRDYLHQRLADSLRRIKEARAVVYGY